MRFRPILPVIAGMIGSLALAPGAAVAQREPILVDSSLSYDCAEAGPVTVRVTASLPATGTVGDPVEPSHTGVEVTVPAAALTGLPDAASVTSVAKLDVLPQTWTAVLSEPVPLADPVVLGGTVTAPPVTPDQPGDLAFTAGNLSLTVTGYTADGTPTEPPSVDLTCVLDPAEESASLGTVAVTAPDGTTTPTPPPGKPTERDPGGLAAAATPAPDWCYKLSTKYPTIPSTYSSSFCTYLAGYANVKKLNASVLQPAGQVNIAATNFVSRTCPEGPNVLCQKAYVLPELNGQPQMPPSLGSFLTLGVIPTTGSIQLTQVGLADVYLWSTATRPYQGLTTVKVKLTAQILDESPPGVVPHTDAPEVNGVPLHVGPDCKTAEPIDAVFTATYDEYSISKGGVMKGTVTIPPFSGCGVTEDLDPLFTNLVSGPGNYVKLTQGAVCTVGGNNNGCPPVKPEPKR